MRLKNPTLDQALDKVHSLAAKPSEVVIIFLGEQADLAQEIPDLVSRLQSLDITFVGAIFPSVICDVSKHDDGFVAIKLPTLEKPQIIKGLEDDNLEYEFPHININKHQEKPTFITLVDGLTANVAGFLSALYSTYGDQVNYIGGGGGSLTLVQKPCLFCNEGFFQDAALLIPIDKTASLGVKHGWKKLLGPFVVSDSHKNLVKELNWKNAFEAYKEVVEADSGKVFNDENFFEIAKGYPFGIFKEGQEDIVRDPIAVTDKGELVCVGEVPKNAVVYILKGTKNDLITSAGVAAQLAVKEHQKGTTLVIDCISRVLFLEDDFFKELDAIKKQTDHIIEESCMLGALTLGEISSYGEGFLEFFNKTTVVGVLYD